jgi:plasmid stabilization system protein ParE
LNYQLDITLPAQQDVDRAVAWYDNQSPGLGDEFRDEVAKAFATIRSMPGLFAPNRRGARIGPVHRFPYFVLYRESGDTVTVYAVFHGHRHPAVYQSRR